MREIKFRGKRLDNGEWVYGCLCCIDNEPVIVKGSMKWVDGSKLYCNTFHFVIPESVGQYTGLKDKNGKEIYEGDIVTGLFNHTDIIGHIVYGSDATFFIERKGLYGIGLNNAEDWLEVVGNIYENPELLKE
jgi:uncharacterized phage protein (TIGR01671 family)